MDAAEKLTKARCRLITKEPFYGTFAIHMKWIPSEFEGMPEEAKTLGVRIVNKQVECLYYPPFIDKYSVDDCMFFLQHEIEHIVRMHIARKGDRHHQVHNIAADMSIHGHQKRPKIGVIDAHGKKSIPDDDKWIWVPKEWDNNLTSEDYYDKLMENAKFVCPKCGQEKAMPQNGQGDGNGDEKDQDGNNKGQSGQCNCGHSYGRTVDNHDIWEQSTEKGDEARQIVKSIVDETLDKTKGSAPGHLQEAIEALKEPIVYWQQILRHYIGRHVGSKRSTWSRRNRRIRRLGFKGTSHHAASKVNVIIDTSGSISNDELKQFFAEIEAILTHAKVTCIQWDTQLQRVDVYRRGDWKKIDICGRGGTMMEKSVDWLVENRMVADLQIMLTDGYTAWPDPQPFPMLFVITTEASGPNWGHVVRLD